MPLTCIAILCIASLMKQFSSKQNAEIRHVHLAWLRDLSTEKKKVQFLILYWQKGLKLSHKLAAIIVHNLTFPIVNLGNDDVLLVQRTMSLGNALSYFITVSLELLTRDNQCFLMWASVSTETTANCHVITTPDTSIAVIFLEVKHEKNVTPPSHKHILSRSDCTSVTV